MATTWNPKDRAAGGGAQSSVDLTNGNITATIDGQFQGVRGTTYRETGKAYLEFLVNSVGGGVLAGIALDTWIGFNWVDGANVTDTRSASVPSVHERRHCLASPRVWRGKRHQRGLLQWPAHWSRH
jgi:hypothetical protein